MGKNKIKQQEEVIIENRGSRHIQLFYDEINVETVQNLIDDLNKYVIIDLFFSTHGGMTSAMDALIHYLNGRKNDIRIYLTSNVASAGTFILTDFEGEVFIAKDLDYLIMHTVDRPTYNNRKGFLNKAELQKHIEEANENLALKYEKLGLTKKEIKRFKAGEDVVLYRDDFKRLNVKML